MTAGDAPGNAPGDSTDGNESQGGLQTFDGMAFRVPDSWQAQELSAMQKGIIAARFGIPEVDPEMTVTLSVSGGSKADNIARWEGQFSGGPPLQQEVLRTADGEADLIRLSGRFSPGFGRPPVDDWAMLGLIIPLPAQHYFVKLTGPQAAVDEVESEFLEFCRSARPD